MLPSIAVSYLTAGAGAGTKLAQGFGAGTMGASAAGNAPHIHKDTNCGCFACKRRFQGHEVVRFIPESHGSKTALCPYCELDAVLSEKTLPAGLSCSDELLALMNVSYFNGWESMDQ